MQCSGFAIAGGLLQQLQARLNPVRKALVECAVCKQRQQGWGDPHREPRLLLWIACSRFKHLYQGEIALDQRLKKPVFFKRVRFACSHIGEVRMENKG